MIKFPPQEKDTVSEKQFLAAAGQCLLLFQQYKLKTNVIALNLEKEMVPECYYELEGRMIERYDILLQELQEAISKLENSFRIAKATHLRSLNNIMRNYRRRVGIINNEPMANFKYNKFDKSQKILLQALVYNEKDSYEDILKFKQDLTFATQQGKNQIRDHYRRNPKIDEDYKLIFEVIDKTECYTYKYYENFERSMQTTVASLQSFFDKLNGYLTVWENLGSIKAYEIKSAKQLAMEDKKHNSSAHKIAEDYTEQQIQELIMYCPENSSKRQDLKARLVELKQFNKQKERKMEKVGKMFNRRRNRDGILTNRRKDITVLDWYFNLENEKSNLTFSDEMKLVSDGINSQYRPSQYQIQRPLKRQKIQQMKEQMQKAPKNGFQFSSEWWYDKYGKETGFNLILGSSQQIQKRVQFEINRQVDMQNADDRKKRDIFDRQTHHIRDFERRQALHIGYLYANEKEQLQQLQDRTYNTDYLPHLIDPDRSESSLEFTDQQVLVSDDSDSEQQPRKQQKKIKKKQKKKKNIQKEQPKIIQTIDKKIANHKKSFEQNIQEPNGQQSEEQNEQQNIFQFNSASLERKLIESYFKQYSKKVLRKQAEPEYKKSKFIYFPDLSQVQWHELINYFSCEKIFVYTKETIIYIKRVFSAKTEKIKCIVYTLKDDLDQDSIRQELTNCFIKLSLVTVKFISIYSDLEGQDKISFMIGLLLVLVQKGQMIEGYEHQNYIKEGKIIIEDFHCYFNPQDQQTSKNIFIKPRQSKATSMFTRKQKQADEDSKQIEKISEKGTVPTIITANTDKYQFEAPEEKVAEQNQTNKVEEQTSLKRNNSKQILNTYQLEKQLKQNEKSDKENEQEVNEQQYVSL